HSNQQSIFDNGLAAIETFQDVKNYVQTAEVEQAMNQLEGILNDPIPYGKIKDIPSLVHVLDEQIEAVLSEMKNEADKNIKSEYDEASLQTCQNGVSNQTKQQIDHYYENMLASLEAYTDIYKVDAVVTQSNTYKMKAIQNIQR